MSQAEAEGKAVLTGAFDEPTRMAPTFETGVESKLAWVKDFAHFSGTTTTENSGAEKVGRIVSYQHPDHDTEPGWSPPPEKSVEDR